MIEGLLFPHRSASLQEFVDAMRRGALHALQNVDEGERPPISITQRREQQVNVIRHHDGSVQINPLRCGAGAHARECRRLRHATFAQAMRHDQIASLRRQDSPSGAERDKQIAIHLLQMRQPPLVPILRKRNTGHKFPVCVGRAPPRANCRQCMKTKFRLSVTDEHPEPVLFCHGRPLAGGAPAPHL
jgi:hypothetical protein